jgi:hypothetical protein
LFDHEEESTMAAQVTITINTPYGDASIDEEDVIIRDEVPADLAAMPVLANAVRRAIGAITTTPERRAAALEAFVAAMSAEVSR